MIFVFCENWLEKVLERSLLFDKYLQAYACIMEQILYFELSKHLSISIRLVEMVKNIKSWQIKN